MSLQPLEDILARGDVEACVKFFAKFSEKERRTMAKDVQSMIRAIVEQTYVDLPGNGYELNPLGPVAGAAQLAICDLRLAKGIGRWPAPDAVVAIFAARKVAWLDEWVSWECERRFFNWPVVRALVRAGLCRQPNSDNYPLGMSVSLSPDHRAPVAVYDSLLRDPDLLRNDIWRIFEVEGNMDTSLAVRDSHAQQPDLYWSHALLRLAKEKKLPRKRLLDASLDALARDFSPFQAGWFSRFHEALEPTSKERVQRAGAYLSLLRCRAAPTVTFAINALSLLTNENVIEPSDLLAAIPPALTHRTKAAVLSALELIGLVSLRNPLLRSEIGLALAEALLHGSPDIHKKAIDLLCRGDGPLGDELSERLRERVDQVAASQRPRLLALLTPIASAPPAKAGSMELDERSLRKRAAALDPKWRKLAGVDRLLADGDSGHERFRGLAFNPTEIHRLVPETRLAPIETVDELVDVCSHVLENPQNATELERVLDGISRLCADRPDDFAARTGPLRKRALDRLTQLYAAPFFGQGPLIDLCGVVHAWLAGEITLAKKTGVNEFDRGVDIYQLDNGKRKVEIHERVRPSVERFQSQRALEIAERSRARQAAPLLAAPTHRGGWIDPTVLVHRALVRQKLSVAADRFDRIQALLRLAPDGRPAAKKSAGNVLGEFGQALRYALGGAEAIGPDAALWIAAARASNPFGDDVQLNQVHPNLGPNAADAAQYDVKTEPRPNDPFHRKRLSVAVKPPPPRSTSLEAVTVYFSPRPRPTSDWRQEYRKSEADLNGILMIWPIQREAWFAVWARTFSDNLDWYSKEWGNRIFLEPLLDPDVPLGPMARLTLALGLAARETGENSLATDALIASIDDARFDADQFAAAVALIMPILKAARLARTLDLAARTSPLHRRLINRAVQSSLRGDPADVPRDFSTLLEFLKESLIETGEGVADPEARKCLESIKPAGKSGRFARDLLSLKTDADPAAGKGLFLQVLHSRIRRAETWSSTS